MSNLFEECHRQLQRQFDTERLADRIEERLCRDRIGNDERSFIERMDMFFLATVDGRGQPSCSYKGGDPGFVRVLDERQVMFPNYDGNGMFLSMGNLSRNPGVGMLFIDLASPKRLRLNGVARIEPATCAAPPYAGAQFVVVVTVRALFPNCPRYIHRHAEVERSKFVPLAGLPTPVPAWKQMDWARDVLPAGDPAAGPPAN